MSVVPGGIDTERGPPMAIPLVHFLVALAFLLAGSAVGAAAAVGAAPGWASLAHLHLLLAGWICVTIMGAMTQFVPVWSGVSLHSRRLATAQLWLVAGGLVGFAAVLLSGRSAWLAVPGALVVAGFWTFAYNLARTLPRPADVTERHFALALAFLVVATGMGWLLALDLAAPILVPGTRSGWVGAHATLAVFGVVLTTVAGALYQLATMFTGTELHGVDVHLRRIEEIGYPAGVVALAAGRLLGAVALARIGGVLVVVGLLALGSILGRKLYETRVDRTPMLTRYAVAAAALWTWGLLALPAWLRNPIGHRFGAPGTAHLLALGAVGFVVLGTVYHVVPFVVWVHRYSDRLGLEDVPMIDDLYDGRLAAADLALFLSGTAALSADGLLALPEFVTVAGGGAVLAGAGVVVTNVLVVVRRHSPYSLWALLAGAVGGTGVDPEGEAADADPTPEGR